MIIGVFGFVASFLTTWVLIRVSSSLGRLLLDHDLDAVQKFHSTPVPRIGGISIFLAFSGCVLLADVLATSYIRELTLLLACSLPAFCSGVIEDVTKKVSPRIRLLCAMAASCATCLFLHAVIRHVDLPGLSSLLSFSVLAVGLTVLAVAGLSNSINIIDGFNGLASIVSVTIFASIVFVSLQVGDPLVLAISLTMIGSILGFWLWNFPGGAIFLGDGGAYFIGFMLGEAIVLLIARHPNVSPGYAIVALYPLFETLFSIYRRKFVRGTSPSVADGVHLHTLLYRRVVLMRAHGRDSRLSAKRNAMTSPYLWVLNLFAVVPATLFWNDAAWLAVSAAAFVALYVALYRAIVRFRTPRWLFLRSSVPSLTDGLFKADTSDDNPPSLRG